VCRWYALRLAYFRTHVGSNSHRPQAGGVQLQSPLAACSVLERMLCFLQLQIVSKQLKYRPTATDRDRMRFYSFGPRCSAERKPAVAQKSYWLYITSYCYISIRFEAAGEGTQGTGPDLPAFVLSCAAMNAAPAAITARRDIVDAL
jgi:hypothetical protein